MAALNLLSVRQIDALPEGFHSDGGNLYLRIRGTSRSWVFRFKISIKALWAKADDRGKAIEIGLGAYPARTLAQARRVAEVARSDLANGIDPRKRLRPDDEKTQRKTFKEYALEYIASKEKGWRSPIHRAQWRSTLADYAYPLLGDKHPEEIRVSDVLKVIEPLWATKTETATRVRQRIEAIIGYAYVREEIDRGNPARWKGNLSTVLTDHRDGVKSHAAPPWQAIPTIMASLREKPAVTSALAMRFSILTGARSMEARGLTWGELDLEAAVWLLPKARSKNKKEHAVPLNAEALAILTSLKTDAHKPTDLVFPGAKGGIISDVAINKTLHAAMPGITAHGTARSCLRTWLADATEYSDKVSEAVLNHTNPNNTEAAYVKTRYFDRRVAVMKEWGEFCAGSTSNN